MGRRGRGNLLTVEHLNKIRTACLEQGVANVPRMAREMDLQHRQNISTQLVRSGFTENLGIGKYAWRQDAPEISTKAVEDILAGLRAMSNEASRLSHQRQEKARKLKEEAEKRKQYQPVEASNVLREQALEDVVFPDSRLIRGSLAMLHKKLDLIMHDLGLEFVNERP